MRKTEQSQEGEKPPLEYLRDISNQTSWEGLAAQISVISGERVAASTLWRASCRGWDGFKDLKLSVGQFKALTELTGLSFDELYKLSLSPKQQKTRQPDELN